MITIHHLGVSQSDRIVWLMEELDMAYELQWHHRGEDFLAPESYRALHPAGTSPIIVDGDTVLCESLAIVLYVLNRYGNGRFTVSPESPRYSDYLYWLAFSQSYSANLMYGFMGAPGELPEGMPRTMAELGLEREQRGLVHMNDVLAERDYLAGGDFSATEFMNMFPLTSMSSFVNRDLSPYPNVQRYIERISGRPAYQKAMQLAGPSSTPPSVSG